MKFKSQTLNEFIQDVQSSKPSPGGGAVAGLVASLAGSLNSMVYSLTVGKKRYNDLDDETKENIKRFQLESEKFSFRSLELMEEDRKNFLELMNSYKLPKETDEEKQKRQEAIRINTRKAMEAPLSVVREGIKFYENLKIMMQYGNKMLLSDLQMSAILLHAAIESSIVNTKINLNSLKDEEDYNEICIEIDEIMKLSIKEKEEICNKIEKSLY